MRQLKPYHSLEKLKNYLKRSQLVFVVTFFGHNVLTSCNQTEFKSKQAKQLKNDSQGPSQWNGQNSEAKNTEPSETSLIFSCEKKNYSSSTKKKTETILIPNNCASVTEVEDTTPKTIEIKFLMNVANTSKEISQLVADNLTQFVSLLKNQGNKITVFGVAFSSEIQGEENIGENLAKFSSQMKEGEGIWKIKELTSGAKAGTSDWIQGSKPAGALEAQLKAIEQLQSSDASVKILLIANTFPGLIHNVQKLTPVWQALARAKNTSADNSGKFVYAGWGTSNREKSVASWIHSPLEQQRLIASLAGMPSGQFVVGKDNAEFAEKISKHTAVTKKSTINCYLKKIIILDSSNKPLFQNEFSNKEDSGTYELKAPSESKGQIWVSVSRECSDSPELQEHTSQVDMGV